MSDLPYDLQLQLFTNKRQTLNHILQGRNLAPDVAQRVAGIANTWKDLRPGVVVSLAQAGYDQNAPEVKTVAQLATQQAANLRQWQRQLSGVTTLKDLKIPDDQYNALPPQLQHAYAHRAQQLVDQQTAGGSLGGLGSALDYLPVASVAKGVAEGASPTELLTRAIPGAKLGQELEGKALGVATQAPVVGPPLKTGVQQAALAAQTPLDVLNASIRVGISNAAQGKVSLAQMTPGDIQQSLQQTAEQTPAYQRGVKGLSLGAGLLPDPHSPAVEAAAQAARQYGPETIGGHAFTPGRWFADQIFEPNTEPFRIASGFFDAGIAIKFDPSAQALGLAGDIRAAEAPGVHLLPETQTLDAAVWRGATPAEKEALLKEQSAGLYRTTGPASVNTTQKQDWLSSPEFADGPAQKMADLTSPSEIKRQYPDLPVVDIHDRPVLRQLSEANTADDVRNIISGTTEIQGPKSLPGMSYKVRRVLDNRLFANMPYGIVVDPTDKNTNWKVFDDIMRGANVSESARNKVLDTYVRNDNIFTTTDAMSDVLKDSMMAFGTDEATAKQRAAFFKDAVYRQAAYDVNQATGVERLRPGLGIDGRGQILPAPSLSTEQFNGPLVIPDLRSVRRSSSEFSFLTGTKPWEIGQTALALPATSWKAVQVLTARMAVRIFGETQLLLAARGYTNAFTHPIRYIALQMGDHPDGFVTKMLDKIPGLDPTYLYGPDGLEAGAHADNLLMHSALSIHGPETVATKGFLTVPTTHPDAPTGYAEMLGRAAGDPIVRGVAQADSPLEAKNWFWDGEGAKYRPARARITETQDTWMRSKLASGEISGYLPVGDIVNDRAAADRYIDDVIMPRIRDLSGNGDTEVMDALRTGKLNGVPIYTTPSGNWESANIHQSAIDKADQILMDGRGPKQWVIIRDQVAAGGRGPNIAQKTLDHVFHGLVDVPDRELNRIPAWKQLHWDETIKNLRFVDPEGYDTILARAEAANLPKDLMDRIRNTVLDGTSEERLTADQLTTLSKANTADRIQNIVHDLQTRSQFFDMTRFLFPFGDAFRLIARRWLTTIEEEPQLLERMRQGIYAAKQPGSRAVSLLSGDPVPAGQGFFHKDPFGQDVFTVPGSTWMNTKLLGVPIPLNGHVSGLSMIGEGYPGLGGPSLTLPAKWFLPHTPTGDKVREVIFPFGGGESQGLGADIGQTFVPSWLQKVADGPIDARARANSINAMLQVLASTGRYDLQGPNAQAEQQRLVADAESKSRLLYTIRGAAQFVIPSAPSPETMIHDKSGKLVVAQVLADRYRKHVLADGPDQAMGWFLKTFGVDNIFATQKASTAIGYAAPVTKEAQAWVDSHPDVRTKYPLTYGLFAPSGGNFDISTYGEQFKTGDRRPLTSAEQVAQAENRLGFYAYNQIQQNAMNSNGGKPLTSGQQQVLSQIRDKLKEEFPGFDSFAASPFDTVKRRTAAIDEISRAVDDPMISRTTQGQAVAQYLELRDAAIQASQQMGLRSPFQAQKALLLRTVLRTGAQRLISSTPAFQAVWDNIFSRELARDPGT